MRAVLPARSITGSMTWESSWALVVSFVCSIGSVRLAVVRWKGGIRFGGLGLIPGPARARIPEQASTADGHGGHGHPGPGRHGSRRSGLTRGG